MGDDIEDLNSWVIEASSKSVAYKKLQKYFQKNKHFGLDDYKILDLKNEGYLLDADKVS